MNELQISAVWDDAAAAWVATSGDVPGLVAEAATLEELISEIEILIPELMTLNGAVEPATRFPFHITAERSIATGSAA